MDTKSWIQRFQKKNITVGIIGLGYVGLPLALAFAGGGLKVIGFDNDPEKISAIEKQQESYIKHIDSDAVKLAVSAGFLSATGDLSRIGEVDAVILCLPTPLNRYREPDLSYVIGTLECILPYLHKGQLLSLESTTYPGTTEEELKPRLEQQGFTMGEDFFLVYSPKREDPGNHAFTTGTIPKVVGGVTENCLEAGMALYQHVIQQLVPVSSAKAAELTKLLENIYRSVNIGLVNEMKMVADRMGIDIWEVVKAASTKPFGFKAFYPGPGWGGHCIPIDPFYLTWKAKQYGLNTRFIELAGEINTMLPEWVMHKITDGLNVMKKPINGSKVLVLGLAYKKTLMIQESLLLLS